ncbi:MAG: helix-turn-helix transcriptional regulator [Ruegeria sp.]|nr:helix-turn-helix transcriptional regulator [Ruegeria sp.]
MDNDRTDTPTRSTQAEDYQDLPQAVAVMSKRFADGHRIAPHAHKRDQLLYAVSGVMRVSTSDNSWVVPPDRALLLPAGTQHSVEMRGQVQMRTLYISATGAASAKVLLVTPLLRELIAELARAPMDFSDDPRAERIAELICIEMEAATALPLNIPLPSDPRLQRLCMTLMEDPSQRASLEVLAHDIGASAKTLTRLCNRELGMRFGDWRQRVRFTVALEMLERGETIKSAASHCGYSSPSAFSYAFRRVFGQTPTGFQTRKQGRTADT